MRKRDGFAAAVVIVLAAGAAAGLDRIGTPGGWLIGPLLVGMAAALSGLIRARVPRWAFVGAQAVIGTLIAESFTPPVVASIAHDWAIMIGVVTSTVAAAAVVGWTLARFGSLPASTAAWGSSPGGASGMTAMSEEFGADPRLVAFMQYLRVTLVVLSAGAVTRVLVPGGAVLAVPGTRAVSAAGIAETAAVAAAGTFLAMRARIPAGAVLGPMILGALLSGSGLMHVAVPTPVILVAYLAIGLYVGLLYTRDTVVYAFRVLPQVLGATAALIALCGASALLLVNVGHVDALTAYLATTPGGLDSVTALALSSPANVPLVLAVQALRVFVVYLCGPSVAKLIQRVA